MTTGIADTKITPSQTIDERVFDDGSSETYMQGLYNFNGIAYGVNRFEDITDEHIAHFHDQGYLVIHNAFNQTEVQDGLDGLMDLLDGSSPDFKGVMYEKASQGIDVKSMPAEQKQNYVRKFMWFVEHDRRLKALSEHPKLMAVLSRILDDAPDLFQDMALLKPPHIGREKPWHQDHAYFNLPLETTVVGVWIALDEATTENGCMVINPGTNRRGPVVHFRRRDWQICDTHVNNQGALAVPLKPGGCLLFHSFIQHGTPTNRTDMRRRAVQYHYKPAGVDKIGPDLRLETFGSEGKDVTC
ncbi:MAG: phytanoyl-CoA dioxygenase family protein [Chloroflexota bacterium]